MTPALLLDSALRSLVLGACVLAGLKLGRLRDSRAETMVWTLVLAASLAMPFLTRVLPGGIALPHLAVPRISQPAPYAALGIALVAVDGTTKSDWPSQTMAWIDMHGVAWLWGFYGSVVAAGLVRLSLGLFLTMRMILRAHPVAEDWARGRRVRASTSISGPLSFGFFILLPSDCSDWTPRKRAAVLAHEEAHIRRGDFFIQLAAACHRAVFWFSPFAWWLEARLCALAETASDEAAIRLLDDREGYAEILVEVAGKARRMPAMVAMARGPGVTRRVDHILFAGPERSLGRAARVAVATSALAASLAVAGAHAAIAPAPDPIRIPRFARAAVQQPPTADMATRAEPATLPPARASSSHRRGAIASRRKTAPPPAGNADPVSYDPRALLDAPVAVVSPVIVPVQPD